MLVYTNIGFYTNTQQPTGALLFSIPTSPHHTVSTCLFNHPLCRIILFLTTQMWSYHLSRTNKTFVDVQPSKPLIGKGASKTTYMCFLCLQRFIFYIPKQTSPSVPATCLRYWTLTRWLTAHWVLLQIRLDPWMGNLRG